MEWLPTDPTVATYDGITLREFTLMRGERPVPGVLWQGENTKPGAPLILFGHGASGSRHQLPIPRIAETLVREHGVWCAAIDGPVHGRRQAGEGGRSAFWPEWQRPGTAEDMIADWQFTLDALQALPEVGTGPVGYWGLSMGTIYGAPFVGAEPRIKVAVLGLMGISGPDHYRPTIEAAAANISCPVMFIMQLEDELFTRQEQLKLFDAINSEDKRLHANPGLHPAVPPEELRHSREFLMRYLAGTPEPRIASFRISE
jgi:dienelactone hydrolase